MIIESFRNYRLVILVGFLVAIELFNIVLVESTYNLIITIPQILFVLFLIITGRIQKACYFNLLFTVLCFNTDFGLTNNETILSYAKIKLIGPMTLSYFLGGLIWLLTYIKFPKILNNGSLLFDFFKTIRYLLFSGIILGVGGILFYSYPIEYFLRPLVYILNAYIYLDILMRTYSQFNIKKYKETSFCLLVASPIATFISFFILQIRGSYSVFDALITNEIYTYVPCLLIVLLFGTRHKTMVMISLICYFLNLIAAARGAYFMTTSIALFICIFLVYFCKDSINSKARVVFIIVFPILVFIASSYIIILMNDGGLASQKFNQFLSLGNIFMFNSKSFDFSPETISSSPYIRIGELVNIVYEAKFNPLGFIFGKGYGGSYIDDLGLFSTLDLSLGAFSEDIVKTGMFRTAHSMLPTTLLYNGLIGVILLIKVGIKYLKRIKQSPYVFVAFTLFFYSFYYDPLLIIVSIMLLYGAEHDIHIDK